MTTIAMTLRENSLKERVKGKAQKVAQDVKGIGNKLKENFQEKNENFGKWRELPFKEKVLSIIKSKPVEYGAYITAAAIGTGIAVEGGKMLYENFQKPNSEMNIVIGGKADSVATKYDDTYTDLPKDLGKAQQDTKTLTEKKEVTTNPPTYETEDFMINSDGKLMTKREDTEYKKRIEYTQGYPYFGNMLADMVKGIMIEEQDNPNIDYYIQRLINIANGIQMTEIEKNSPEGKEFNKKYSAQYQKLLKYRLTIKTIEKNYNNGEDLVINTKTKGLVYYSQKLYRDPKFKMTETEKF